MPSRGRTSLLLGLFLAVILIGGCSSPQSSQQTTPPSGQPAAEPASTSVPASAATTAPTAKPASNVTRGGVLRTTTSSQPSSLDPLTSTNGWDRNILFSIYDTLLELDPQGNLKPDLATEWKAIDQTTLEFKLRQGVKFQDGTPFDATAVKFNMDRILDPQSNSQRTAELEFMKSVEVVDPYTVRFLLKNPAASLFALLADRPGMMASPTAVQKWGKDFGKHPVGRGPFQFKEWLVDDHVTLDRFDGYWKTGDDGKPLPYLDGIVFRPTTDETVKMANLKTGNLDFIDTVPPKDASSIQKDNNFRYWEMPFTATTFMRFNETKPPFNNMALRQAISYAIDRDGIVKAVMFDHAIPAKSPFSPATGIAYNKDQKGYVTDPTKAKAKLAEAGVPNGFSFEILTINRSTDKLLAEAIAGQLKEVGITATVKLMEQNAVKDVITQDSGWDATLRSWANGFIDPDQQTQRTWSTGGAWNYGKYSNPKANQLNDTIRTSYDLNARTQALRQLEQLVIDEAPDVYIYHDTLRYAGSTKVQNFSPVPDAYTRFAAVWLSK